MPQHAAPALLATVLALATVVGLSGASPADAIVSGSSPSHQAITVVSTSDGDLAVEPGEAFAFTETLRSSATASNIRGTLRTAPFLTPNSATRAYADITPGQQATSMTPYTARLDPAAECGKDVPAQIALTTDQGPATLSFDIPTGQQGVQSGAFLPTNAAIPDNDPAGVTRQSVDYPAGFRIKSVEVVVDITHTFDQDLKATLTSPAGTTVTLFDKVGSTGENFSDTLFSDEAPTSISAGSAPFDGAYRPLDPLAAFAGEPAEGHWTLKIVDQAIGDAGTLSSWDVRPSFAVCNAPSPAAEPQAGWSGSGTVRGDFDGDGFGDLAIGAPGESVGSSPEAGAVHVLYGTPTGLTAVGSQLWTQESGDVLEVSDSDDLFGASLAAGDFDGDGFADLAIGVPGEDKGAGAVNVLRGTAAGLTGASSQLWYQGSPGVLDEPQDGDHFGATLAAGDFGGTAQADLAIGAPDEDATAGTEDVGYVHRLAGSANGLTATGNQLIGQATSGVADEPEAGDRFGATLAAGDLGWTTRADLAVGVPGEDLGGPGTDHGAVQVLPGAAAGLTATGSQRWTQDTAGILDAAEAGDRFGSALAIGNFDGTLPRDLAIGASGEDLGAVVDAGAVHVLAGGSSGPTATGSRRWTQDTTGILDAAEQGDRFGAALASADFGGGAQSDLAVGAPGESVGGAAGAGIVQTLFGAPNGLVVAGNKLFAQGTGGLAGVAEAGDHFGAALTVGDYGNDSHTDLAVGAPDEGAAGDSGVGIVHVLPGSATGPGSANAKVFSQAVAGIAETPEPGDHFGGGLGR